MHGQQDVKILKHGTGEDQLDDGVRNEEVLQRDKEERNILHTIKRWKGNWTGPNLQRKCLRKQQLLDDL